MTQCWSDMTRWYVWHDSLLCVTWLVDVCDTTHGYMCDATISDRFQLGLDQEYTPPQMIYCRVWYDSLLCVTRLSYICVTSRVQASFGGADEEHTPPQTHFSIKLFEQVGIDVCQTIEVYVCVYVCICVCVCVYIYIYMYVYICVCVCACVYIYLYVCVDVYI